MLCPVGAIMIHCQAKSMCLWMDSTKASLCWYTSLMGKINRVHMGGRLGQLVCSLAPFPILGGDAKLFCLVRWRYVRLHPER